MADRNDVPEPFMQRYYREWLRTQSIALTTDGLLGRLRQGKVIGIVGGKEMPRDYWGHIAIEPMPLFRSGDLCNLAVTYDGAPLYDEIHVRDAEPEPIAIRIDRPVHVKSDNAPTKRKQSKGPAPKKTLVETEGSWTDAAFRKTPRRPREKPFAYLHRVAREVPNSVRERIGDVFEALKAAHYRRGKRGK
jgi:hypothetical protein